MTRPMHPSPATSTTFSCQLSSTLMAAPVDSLEAPGRGPIWLKPVCCGVTRVGVRGALPPDADDVAAMPLYLSQQSPVSRQPSPPEPTTHSILQLQQQQ